MKRIIIGAAMAMAALCCFGKDILDSTPPPMPILSTEISGSDLAFFTGAASQMALLARLSELAKKQAVTPEVQVEAGALEKEQTGAMAQLKTLAIRKHAPADAEVDDAGGKLLQALGKLNGVKFDKSFLDAQGDAEDALQASLEAGAGSSDADIKAFAAAGLETLKAERERVRKLGL